MVSRTSGLKRLLGSVSDVAVVASVAEPCASFSLCDGGKSRIGFAPNAIANRFWIPMRYSSGVSPGRSTTIPSADADMSAMLVVVQAIRKCSFRVGKSANKRQTQLFSLGGRLLTTEK
jgi:hypothetical protein